MACRYVLTKSGTALLQLRSPPVNSLGLDLRADLLRGLENAVKDKADAIVLYGAGHNFCAGADITEFARQKHLSYPSLNEVIVALDELSIPTVAGVHGFTLGGGLELALACHYRVADSTARMGLPEVHLGILPGAGGTQRMPRLVGVSAALDLMTSGRHVGPQEALELGLIDGVLRGALSSSATEVEDPAALSELIGFACSNRIRDTSVADVRISHKITPKTLSLDGGTVDEFFLEYHKKHFVSESGSFRGLKAPANIFKCVQVAAKIPEFGTGMLFEKRAFDELAAGSQAKALQYIFFAEKRNKKHMINLKADKEEELFTKSDSIEMTMVAAAQREIEYLVNIVGVDRQRLESALKEQVGWIPPSNHELISDSNTDTHNALQYDKAAIGAWSGSELASRVMFPMINAGLCAIGDKISNGDSVSPDEVDLSFVHGTTKLGAFPKHHGGPLFWGESVVGLRDVNMRLKELNEEQPEHASYKPSQFLVEVVQGSSTVREDIYFRLN